LGREAGERRDTGGAKPRRGTKIQHGVSFLTAVEIFASEIIERIDDDRGDYGELRFMALGRVDTEIYRVVYTCRGDKFIRIITAQRASKNERETCYREIFT
jgi:uncharacterized DUF497 family protein